MIVTIVIFFVILSELPPATTIMAFGESMTDSWEEKYDNPPIPHTEEMTLREVAKLVNQNPDSVVKMLKSQKVEVTNADAKLKDIADENEYSPQQLFDLTKWLYQYVSNYSAGMRLKLALIRVLLLEPKILFLDEPMLGLDPKSVKDVIQILKNLKRTIFLTSHQMNIVSRLCDRIAFLKQGKILKIDTQDNFKKLITEKLKIEVKVAKNTNQLIQSLKSLDFVSEITDINKKVNFFINNETNFPELFNFLKDYPVIHFNEIKPTLDDVFIKLSK